MGNVICQGCGQEIPSWTGRCPTCGATEIIKIKPKADNLLNRVVSGRYRILSKIGQGGMGAVYLGELVGIGQRVALKFLNPSLSQDPELARRFLNEAKSYARVSHPHAVVLHDFGQDEEGNLYIAMELVEGVDLQRMLTDQGRLAVSDAVEIALQSADVLGYAHSKGVIHRDLKPENIMVRRGTRGLHVKVLDFGIARLVGEGSTRLTMEGAIAGTPRYMAPEQVEAQEVDARVDIYSLGVVLFELLTGLQPFDASSVTEILRKQVVVPMPHIKDAAPDLALDEIDAVIQKATAKDRDQRYATMEEFTVGLSKAAHQLATQPAGSVDVDQTLVREGRFPKTAWPGVSGGRPLPSHKFVWAAGGVALLVVLGGYFVFKMGTEPPAASAKSNPYAVPAATIEKSPTVLEAPPPAKEPTPSTAAVMEAQDVKLREQFLVKEIFLKARNEFTAGNYNSAKTILTSIPKEEESNEDVVKLKKSLDEVTSKLARARALSSRGDCEEAIKVYDQILAAYPSAKDARNGREACKKMLPPTGIE